ncbi:transposase, partial [Streptomyces sp. 2MCAF27]
MALDEEITELDALIEARFGEHQHAEVICGLPGMGTQLGAEFIAATGGHMTAFASADRLAGYGGVAPAARDSGRISGNLPDPVAHCGYAMRVCSSRVRWLVRVRSGGRSFHQAFRRIRLSAT